ATELTVRPKSWQSVQMARNIARPHALDLIGRVFDHFQELHGDRGFRDDPAVVGGIGELSGRPVMIVGQQKGASTEENIARNFGMPHPEGYRKAMRLYRLAEKFHLPLITPVHTPTTTRPARRSRPRWSPRSTASRACRSPTCSRCATSASARSARSSSLAAAKRRRHRRRGGGAPCAILSGASDRERSRSAAGSC